MSSRRPQRSPEPCNQSRRALLGVLIGAGSATLAALDSSNARAQATGDVLPHLSPNEPLAKALGYTEDASTVDRTKFPTFKPGQKCSDCRFYKGAAGGAFGPCQLFGGKDVSARGWCASFSIKT